MRKRSERGRIVKITANLNQMIFYVQYMRAHDGQFWTDRLPVCRFLRGWKRKVRRTEEWFFRACEGAALRYEGFIPDTATQMKRILALRTTISLATDNKETQYRLALIGSNGAEGGCCMRFEFNLTSQICSVGLGARFQNQRDLRIDGILYVRKSSKTW